MPLTSVAPSRFRPKAICLIAFVLIGTAGEAAAQCGNGPAGFENWLQRFRLQAAAQGIGSGTILSTLSGVTYDPTVIRLDRSQRSFKLSFQQFYARRVNKAMINKGRTLMQRHRAVLDRIEKRFGVPAEVLVAIWGLETHYGADATARYSIVRSLATLAYDCRRSEFFTGQLLDALRIIDKGDLTLAQLRGGWAGEIGQTQFLPTPYVRYAVDFDGNGHKDLINSVPDILASTANYLAGHGWRKGEPYGPGSHNYGVITQWNKASVYVQTIATMADQMRGS